MWEWSMFTPLQWACLVCSVVVCAVVTERTKAQVKRESIGELLAAWGQNGACECCLRRERMRLESMDFAQVETERILLERRGFLRL